MISSKVQNILAKIKNFSISNLNVVIIYGGNFSESEISYMSAKSFYNSIVNDAKNITMLNFSDNLIDEIKTLKPDVIINAMHGTFGEDGRLPVILDFLKIPYTHSGYYASFIAMQKDISAQIFANHGIPIPQSSKYKAQDINHQILGQYFKQYKAQKLVIKPVDDGSSVGVQIISNPQEVNLTDLAQYSYVLIEEYIPGLELSVPVLCGVALGCIELRATNGFYDYTNKYTDGKTQHIYPAPIKEEYYHKILQYAEIANKSINCKTISRSDFRFNTENNQIAMLELNTHPGMTTLSIVPDVASRYNITYSDITKILLYDALNSQ